MKLVVDTNILFCYFWKNSITKKLLINQDIELYSPEFALEEINKYRSEIIKKNKLNNPGFKKLRFELAIAVGFIPVDEYSSYLIKALKFFPDPNDVDFFALALKMKLPIWSNDQKLKQQDRIRIITTMDLLKEK